MKHPFFLLSRKQHLLWLGIATAAAILLMLGQLWVNTRLVNNVAPAGILSFEFAGNLSTARLMIHSWDYTAKIRAAFGLGLDFLYLIAYSNALALACLYIAKSWTLFNSFSQAGIIIAWLQWTAALCDGIENAALIALLSDSNRAWLPPLAYWMAAAKFAIVGLAILYLLASFFGLWWQIRKSR